MAKTNKAKVEATVPEEVGEEAQLEGAEEKVEEVATSAEAPKRKTYYNPKTAKAYRERLMEFAKKGGYEPKPRAEGTGQSEKRTSKAGKTYYYTPWSKLTEEQKAKRLEQARTRATVDRELAAKYKAEHPEEFPEAK